MADNDYWQLIMARKLEAGAKYKFLSLEEIKQFITCIKNEFQSQTPDWSINCSYAVI